MGNVLVLLSRKGLGLDAGRCQFTAGQKLLPQCLLAGQKGLPQQRDQRVDVDFKIALQVAEPASSTCSL